MTHRNWPPRSFVCMVLCLNASVIGLVIWLIMGLFGGE